MTTKRDFVTVRIPRRLWMRMKDVVNERHKEGETDFTIADAIEEAIKTGNRPLDKFMEEPA